MFKNSFHRKSLVAASENELLNSSSRFFLFKWMFMNFSNFLLWEVYPSMVTDGQYIFISTYLSLRWQGKSLQQLKLKHEILNMKSLLNVNLYTWSAFIHMLPAWVKHQIVDSWFTAFSNAKNSVVRAESPMCSKFNFSHLKTYFFQFFYKFLNLEIKC